MPRDTRLILVLASLLLAPTVSSAATALSSSAALIQQGTNRGDPALLRKARGQLLGQLAAEPGSAELHCWVAVAAWRAVPIMARTDKDAARRLCEEGLEHCEAALKAEPDRGEALALKAALQGLSIHFNGAAAMVLGPLMQAHMGRAVELAPKDPRIHLLDGINTLHTPEFFGGGPAKALPKFALALELFAAEPRDTSGLRWGHDDAHVWAGRAEVRRENLAAARGYYLKALEINPDNGWVRTSLLPEVERTLAAKESSGP